jgi:Xaa-Pro aminopeptidase
MTMIEWLASQKVCREPIEWLREVRAKAPAEAISLCPRGDWLLWIAEQLGCAEASAALRPAQLRALREHAPSALQLAGLHDLAARLRALPDDVTEAAARDVALQARAAARKAYDDLDGEAERTLAWWAMWVCDAAATAVGTEYGLAARLRYAARAAERAAGPVASSDWTEAWHAALAQSAAEVRAALPDLAARWSAAMEAKQ